MELTVLGSGTGLPTLERGCPGYALRVGQDVALLDTGSGTLAKLVHAGIDFARVRAIFYSHFHLDHTGDLGPFLFAKRNPAVQERNVPLTIHGPRGMAALVRGLQAAYPGPWLDGSSYGLEVVEVDGGGTTFGGALVTAHPVVHTDASVAWRFEGDGRVLCFSGDSDVCPGLVAAARDADLFLCECSFPDARRVAGHLTPRLAGEVAREARARRLLLTHFYPVMETIDPVVPCARAFGRDPIVARDLMRLGV